MNAEIKLPKEFINYIPRQGDVDEYVSDLQKLYEVTCDTQDAIKYLKSTGGWSLDDLQNHDLNINRLIWLACLDCQENKTTYFYMGV